MELKETLKKIMQEEFGIITDEQLNKAYESLDMSEFGVFTQKGVDKDNAA